jgi:VanZ family protein
MSQTKTGLWKEREFIDLWSVVHFFGCFAIGGAFLFFNVTPYIASAIAVGLFTSWEIFELLAKIHEKAANRVSDVIVDYAGFFLAQLYVYVWHGTMYWYIPVITACIALGLETWGIIDHKKRKTN